MCSHGRTCLFIIFLFPPESGFLYFTPFNFVSVRCLSSAVGGTAASHVQPFGGVGSRLPHHHRRGGIVGVLLGESKRRGAEKESYVFTRGWHAVLQDRC